MTALVSTPSRADYVAAFEAEMTQAYPMVDTYERRTGFVLDGERLLSAASVLACPVKAHAPNWQHGRVTYSAARKYLEFRPALRDVRAIDIGTAKGFSALCLLWAITDAERSPIITSVDVLDPRGRVRRNTIAECDGYKTLFETLEPWPDAEAISFRCSTGIDYLRSHPERIHVAFIDGKHSYDAVRLEAHLLALRQQPGDLAIFDDAQIDGVAKALKVAAADYEFEYLSVLPERKYAIGVRRG